jgi:hypothetical protein
MRVVAETGGDTHYSPSVTFHVGRGDDVVGDQVREVAGDGEHEIDENIHAFDLRAETLPEKSELVGCSLVVASPPGSSVRIRSGLEQAGKTGVGASRAGDGMARDDMHARLGKREGPSPPLLTEPTSVRMRPASSRRCCRPPRAWRDGAEKYGVCVANGLGRRRTDLAMPSSLPEECWIASNKNSGAPLLFRCRIEPPIRPQPMAMRSKTTLIWRPGRT